MLEADLESTAGGGRLGARRVVVTRAEHQADSLCGALRQAGARVERLPLLRIVPGDTDALSRAAAELATFQWLVLTSSNAVDAVLPRLEARHRQRIALAVVGPATARAARALGWEPRLEASKSDGEGLVDALAPQLDGETPLRRVLVPQADDAGPHVVEGLRRLGADVVSIVAYRKELPAAAPRQAEQLFADGPLGWVTFTSPRIVRSFLQLNVGSAAVWRRRLGELRPLSVGPVTSAELRRHGIEPAAQAARPTPEAMVEAMAAALDEP